MIIKIVGIFLVYVTTLVSTQSDDVVRVKRADDTNAELAQLSQQVSTLTAELAALKNTVVTDNTAFRNSSGKSNYTSLCFDFIVFVFSFIFLAM